MYAKPQRTIETGLEKFKLIDGQGNGKNTACAMTMLGWLAGHLRWNDHPVCAHDDLADIVINANDEDEGESKVAQKKRANLVKLGYEGVLDTWWIPDEVVEWLTDREKTSDYKYAVAVLKATAKWKKQRFRVQRVQAISSLADRLPVLSKSCHYPGYVWVKVS